MAAEGPGLLLVNRWLRKRADPARRYIGSAIESEAPLRARTTLERAVDTWDPATGTPLWDHARPLIEEALAEASARTAKCSFCGKSQKKVKKLIAGPGVYICDECINLCNDIIREELAEEKPEPARCPRCNRGLDDHGAVHTVNIGNEAVRLLACGGCGQVIGTLP